MFGGELVYYVRKYFYFILKMVVVYCFSNLSKIYIDIYL